MNISATHLLRCAGLPAAVVAAVLCLAACTQDNVHMPDENGETAAWETYTQDFPGTLYTTVPLMQEYLDGPAESVMTAKLLDFNISHSGYVTLLTEPFSITDPTILQLMGMAIDIGSMTIDKVEYAAFPSGGGYLKADAFEVMAGKYLTRGSLQGTVSADGKLSLVLSYRPGSMPFEIRSEFKQGD